MNCWMCGGPAETREHKFKKSDLARSSPTWTAADQPYLVSGSGVQRIQGPRSRLVTFEKVLCEDCNTARTQPYDRAYERFSEWVNQKGSALMGETQLDFAEIYGPNYEGEVLNLLKYFAKHLGCRVASDHYTVPDDLAASFSRDTLFPFEVSFSRNRELGDLPARGAGVLGNFPLLGRYSPATGDVYGPYLSGMIVGYLDVVYRYDQPTRYFWESDIVDPRQRFVRLGEYDRNTQLPHPFYGRLPQGGRRFQIGSRQFDIPVLTPEHAQAVFALAPRPNMTFDEHIQALLEAIYAIVSPFYPDVTVEFLQAHLNIPLADAIWKVVFP